jgi:hypothetical protein
MSRTCPLDVAHGTHAQNPVSGAMNGPIYNQCP